MSEMLERVARALCRHDGHHLNKQGGERSAR